jgi:hypothetical protein
VRERERETKSAAERGGERVRGFGFYTYLGDIYDCGEGSGRKMSGRVRFSLYLNADEKCTALLR